MRAIPNNMGMNEEQTVVCAGLECYACAYAVDLCCTIPVMRMVMA